MRRCAFRIPRWIPVLFLTGGFLGVGGLQPQSRDGSVSPERAVVNRYCVGCHNSARKPADLALDTIVAAEREPAPGGLGEGRPQASRPLICRRSECRGRTSALTTPNIVAGDLARQRGCGQAQSRPNRYVPAAQSNRIPERHPRSSGAGRRCRLAAAERRVQSWLRQCHGRRSLADAAGSLHLGGAEDQPAGGRQPRRSPGGDTIRIPPDLTQEEHVDGLPLGTRGGTLIRYTFPQDAEYDIQIRLTRDRNEHVEGLDARRTRWSCCWIASACRLFTVKPPRGDGNGSSTAVDKDLKVRIPVKAGPHDIGVTFLKNPSALLETKRQPYQAHFNMDRHPRIPPAIYQISITGPYDAKGPGDTPSRRRIFVCQPAKPAEEEACAKTHSLHPDAPGLSAAGYRCGPSECR